MENLASKTYKFLERPSTDNNGEMMTTMMSLNKPRVQAKWMTKLSGLIVLIALGSNFAYALNNNYQEVLQPDENKLIQDLSRDVSQGLIEQKNKGTKPITRDAHAKAHGCVRAQFTVTNQIPSALKVGVFKEAKTFPAWIRFSNASGKSDDDTVDDARGLAIKLMGVDGEKILDSEKFAKTQDFVMINNKSFFVAGIADYIEFFKQSKNGSPMKFFFPGISPGSWRLSELQVARQLLANKMVNPGLSSYWSTTAYQLGENVIHFSAQPCVSAATEQKTDSSNFLRENLASTLKQQDLCFDFLVQVGTDIIKYPIENPLIEWSEEGAPFVKVARLDISKQEFQSESQMNFCENLSFTPWHALPEHRPLGGINRARRVVYETISGMRHQMNGVHSEEPSAE